MTQSETAKVLSVLQGAFPRVEIREETLMAYAVMFQDMAYDNVRSAVKRLLATCKFFPTIAEIRSEVAEGAVSHLPDVALTWGCVVAAIGRFGAYRVPQFDNPEVAEAVRAIGWREICLSQNIASTRARFTSAYEAVRERTKRGVQLGEFGPALPEPEQAAIDAPVKVLGSRQVRLGDVALAIVGDNE